MNFRAQHPYNSPSKSCFLAPRAKRRILIFSGMFWAHHVLSSTNTIAFLTAQGTILTLQRLERAIIKFWLLLVPHVLRSDVDRMSKNPVGIGERVFPLVPFFL